MASTARSQFGVAEVMDVIFYNLATGKPELFLDTLKMTNLENTADEKIARGGQGNPILITWDFDREANFEIQDALLSPKTLELLTGNQMVQDKAVIRIRQETEYDEDGNDKGWQYPLKTDEEGRVTLGFPVYDKNNVFVYKRSEELDKDAELNYSVNPTDNKELTVYDYEEVKLTDTEVIVYYKYETSHKSQIYTITADSFPGEYEMVGSTVVRNLDGVDEPFQVVVPRCKLQPGFEVNMQPDGDPSVFDMNVTVYRDRETPEMIRFIKY